MNAKNIVISPSTLTLSSTLILTLILTYLDLELELLEFDLERLCLLCGSSSLLQLLVELMICLKIYIDVMIYINGGRALHLSILPVFDNN